MGELARVTSVEAIKAFRARLVVFLAKARPTLEEVSNEVVRTRLWLQVDQRRFWEHELRQRKRKLEQLEADLFSATLSAFREAVTGQQIAVRRARDAVRDAERKLVELRKWDRELEQRSEPLMKQVDQLHHFITTDMSKAVAHLDRIIVSLEAYSEVQSAGADPVHGGKPQADTEPEPAPPATGPNNGSQTP